MNYIYEYQHQGLFVNGDKKKELIDRANLQIHVTLIQLLAELLADENQEIRIFKQHKYDVEEIVHTPQINEAHLKKAASLKKLWDIHGYDG